MKAAIINQFGGPGVLQIAEVEKPAPGPKEVCIKVNCAGINPVDTKVRAGTSGMSKYLKLPAIIGWDVSGTVESVGRDITNLKAGDAVFGCIGFPGAGSGYAEYTVADPELLAIKPSNISFEEAAAIPLAGLTAYQAIHEQLRVTNGQKILVQAASGGVGHLAVQFAKLNGAYVFATASGKNEAFVKSLGADRFIDYKKEDFAHVATGLDAALDAMGSDILYRSIDCVKKGGRVLCLPSSTKDDPAAIAKAKDHGVEMLWFMMRPDGGQMRTIARLLGEKKVRVKVDKIFTLDQVEWAHKAVESHQTSGKVIVKM